MSAFLIKACIVLGIVALVLISWGSARLSAKRISEFERFVRCTEGQEQDCRPSMVWVIFGWQLPLPSTSLEMPSAATTTLPAVSP